MTKELKTTELRRWAEAYFIINPVVTYLAGVKEILPELADHKHIISLEKAMNKLQDELMKYDNKYSEERAIKLHEKLCVAIDRAIELTE